MWAPPTVVRPDVSVGGRKVLRQQIEPIKQGELHSNQHIAHVSRILSDVRLDTREWQQYATFRRGRYTRTLVGYDAKFVALLLCWERGQRSPIHDHAGASCWVKMLAGSIEEVRFSRADDGRLVEVGSSMFDASQNDVSYMNDSLGVHQIINPSSDEQAVSLHIYAPPFQQCRIFAPTTGEAKVVSMVAPFDCAARPAACEAERDDDTSLSPLFFGDTPDRLPPSAAAWTNRGMLLPEAPPLTIQELVLALRELRHAFIASPFNGPAASSTSTPNGDEGDEVACGSEWELSLVRQALDRLQLSQADIDQFCSPAHFSEFRYGRTLVHLNDQFSLMVLCWGPEQGTPIHSHGVGVRSWFKVMHGELKLEALETDMTSVSRDLVVTETLSLGQDSASVEEYSSLGLHRVSNPSTDQPAISVHLYSPPLKELCYREAGVDYNIPVSYGQLFQEEKTQNAVGQSGQGPYSGLPVRGSLFTNFDALREFLDSEFKTHTRHQQPEAEFDARLTRVLKLMQFNPMEWQGNAAFHASHFTRTLLAQTDQFSIVLTCWDRQQYSPPHDHAGSKSWVKVLQGQIDETQYEFADRGDDAHDCRSERLRVSRSGSLASDSLTFLGPNTIHSCVNNDDEPCVTLHVYAPPYQTANFYDDSGHRTQVQIPSWYGGSE